MLSIEGFFSLDQKNIGLKCKNNLNQHSNFRFTSESQRGKLQSCEKLQISQNHLRSWKSWKVLHFKAVKLDQGRRSSES